MVFLKLSVGRSVAALVVEHGLNTANLQKTQHFCLAIELDQQANIII